VDLKVSGVVQRSHGDSDCNSSSKAKKQVVVGREHEMLCECDGAISHRQKFLHFTFIQKNIHISGNEVVAEKDMGDRERRGSSSCRPTRLVPA
jgi:hypothetical protein